MRLLVTGGAGFIGSALIRQLLAEEPSAVVINADKLTYAGNLECLESVSSSPKYYFERVDICDAGAIRRLFDRYEPDAVIHLASETHVDRSIDGPSAFMQTNILGTYTSFFSGDMRLVGGLAIILVVLLVRPAGIFGRVTARKCARRATPHRPLPIQRPGCVSWPSRESRVW